MEESEITHAESTQYCIAIHEAAHLVVRYLLFGNIDIIEYVNIIPHGNSLGRNKEDFGKKNDECANAFDYDVDFFEFGGYAFKECCYSLAGAVAEKVFFNLENIPYDSASEDLGSLDSFIGLLCDEETFDSLVKDATPETEKIVRENIGLIKMIADALISTPEHQLDNHTLLDLLE